MVSISRLALIACVPLASCQAGPPSLQVAPPSYYRTYVIPQHRMRQGMQPRVVVIERASEPRPALNGSANEIDSRIEGLQREIEIVLDKTKAQ